VEEINLKYQISNNKYQMTNIKFLNLSFDICYLIFVLAFALRLYQLNTDSLWEDEIFTATQSPLPLNELLRWTAGDIHPPGYYVLMGRLSEWGGWAHQPPSALTDWLWRFPSALMGALAVAATYRLGKSLFGRRVGLVGALLLALSPVALQYSQEARMHEMFLLGTALSTWALVEALDRPERWQRWLAYALATALNLYAVYLGFVVLAAQAALVGWKLEIRDWRLETRSWKLEVGSWKPLSSNLQSLISTWLLSVALAFALYLPWWPTLLGIVNRRLEAGSGGSGVGSPLAFAMKAIDSLGPGAGWPAWLFLALWATGLVSVARRRPALAAFGGLWLLLPLGLPLILGDPRALHVRYAFLLPVYLLFAAQGARQISNIKFQIPNIKRPSGRLRSQTSNTEFPALRFDIWHLIFALVLALVSIFYLPGYYRQTKPDWRGVAGYLAARTRPGDAIVTDALFDAGRYLDYYYSGPAELVTPALLVTNLSDRVASMRASSGRVWVVTRFRPKPLAAIRSVEFPGLVISEPVIVVYEPQVLTAAMIDLMQQAVAAAPGWAAQMSAEGVMDPDPWVSQAAAYLFLGDTYRAAGRLPDAVAAYQGMVADHPTPGGYVLLAKTLEMAGQPEQAVKTYQQAVVLNRAWQGPDADAAAALAASGRWVEAAAAYRAAVAGESTRH
jgi:4-amino-4-deoxy-L-arabinose transferase-like glycosyltransferase